MKGSLVQQVTNFTNLVVAYIMMGLSALWTVNCMNVSSLRKTPGVFKRPSNIWCLRIESTCQSDNKRISNAQYYLLSYFRLLV